MRTLIILTNLLALAFAIEAGAQIYRCEIDGQLTFSDIPCSDESRPYESSGSISIVAAPAGLDRIQEENRSFVERRREEFRERIAQSRSRQSLMTASGATESGASTLPYRGVTLHRPVFSPLHPDRRSPRRPGERPAAPEDAEVFQPGNTLLSRSGSTRRKILR